MSPEATHSTTPQLVRVIGRWSMVALAVNCIVGSGIFGLPSSIARLAGSWSPLLVLLTGLAMAVVIGCYAEAASQFTESGGHYIYVRRAFGRFAGIQVGWLNLLGRLTAAAAAVNLLVVSLAGFWPQAGMPGARFAIETLVVGTLAAANYRGVAAGTLVSNVSTIAKLVPLAVVCVVGLGYLATHASAAAAPAIPGWDPFLKAMLLLFFLIGGHETSLNPMGEAKDPRHDTVFALFAALIVVTLLYAALQLVVVGVLPGAAGSARPLVDAAQVMMGSGGAMLVSVGVLIAIYGYLSANLLSVPRGTFALAEGGDFPAAFAAIHPRFHTPHVSILAVALAVWAFALFGSFEWNVTLSAAARLTYYGAVCASVPVLRRLQPDAAAFRLPFGPLLPALGVLICLTLL